MFLPPRSRYSRSLNKVFLWILLLVEELDTYPMNYKAKSTLALALAGALIGCSSNPPAVTAKVPLMSQNAAFSSDYLSEELSLSLDRAKRDEKVLMNGKVVLIQGAYTSALGLPCKRVQVTDSIEQLSYLTAACKSSLGWFLTPTLMPVSDSKE